MNNNGAYFRKLASGPMGRREFVRRSTLTALTLSAVPSLAMKEGIAASKEVSAASYGGSYNDSIQKAFMDSFEKETGIKVNLGANASLALAKLQNASGGAAQWDIVELNGSEYELAVRDNLLLPYDYGVVDPTNIAPEYKRPYGVKVALFLWVMAWDRRKIADKDAPKNWAEFWDTKRYPGKRSLYSNVADGSILEAALLADGVPIDKLYPLDVERALKSLDRLGKENIIWHNTNQEPIQQMTSGEVSLSTVFDGRVILANKGGAQLGFTPEYGAVSGDYWSVMKSSQRAPEAFKLLNYMVNNTKAAADWVEMTTYGVPNTKVLPLLPKEVADTLPSSPALKGKVFNKDDAWWAENLEKTSVRFKEWQLGG
jgi:putative spermidine/putrescine transport system substrate-binding protein